MREDIISILNAEKAREELKKGKRISGRKVDEYRSVEIQTSHLKNAHGSAQVKLGKTEIIAGSMMVPGTPYPDSPDSGSISVGVEMMPLASPEFESGPPSPFSIELARVVDRGIREGQAIDFQKLCITEGEHVWFAYVDLYIANDDGNLFDCSALAATAALLDTKMPKFEDGKVVKKEFSGKLEVKRKPILVTTSKIDDSLIVDADLAETKATDARFSVATTDDGLLSAYQKGLGGSFLKKDLDKALDWAFSKGKELRKFL